MPADVLSRPNPPPPPSPRHPIINVTIYCLPSKTNSPKMSVLLYIRMKKTRTENGVEGKQNSTRINLRARIIYIYSQNTKQLSSHRQILFHFGNFRCSLYTRANRIARYFTAKKLFGNYSVRFYEIRVRTLNCRGVSFVCRHTFCDFPDLYPRARADRSRRSESRPNRRFYNNNYGLPITTLCTRSDPRST